MSGWRGSILSILSESTQPRGFLRNTCRNRKAPSDHEKACPTAVATSRLSLFVTRRLIDHWPRAYRNVHLSSSETPFNSVQRLIDIGALCNEKRCEQHEALVNDVHHGRLPIQFELGGVNILPSAGSIQFQWHVTVQ
jgi:hypothetical protein